MSGNKTTRIDIKRLDALLETKRLLEVVRRKYSGLLLVSYEDEYRRNDLNLREKIDAALKAAKGGEE